MDPFVVDGTLSIAHRTGRSLLNHCWDDAAHTSTSSGDHTNGDWMRVVAWSVNLIIAVVFLVLTVRKWPPPPRVFPRRRPLLSVPWCCWARLLGYGVFDWRTGKLAPWWDFLKERHEILNVFAGDSKFITQRCRFAHLMTELSCTAAVSMVLTDLSTGRVSGGFRTKQIWVFALLLTYDIVLGIALRLATLGATKASFEAAERVGFECAESGEIEDLENEEQLIEMGIKASHAFNIIQYRFLEGCLVFSATNLLVCGLWTHLANPADGCGDSWNTFLAYMYVFGLYQGFTLVFVSPLALTARWTISAFLITRISEVQTPQETMQCCWRQLCPKLCSCVPPLVTPIEERTVSATVRGLIMSPRKKDAEKVTTGQLAASAAAAAVGKSRYTGQESPMTPVTPVTPFTRDVEFGQVLDFDSPSPLYDEGFGSPELTPTESSLRRTASGVSEPSPSEKYAMLRRSVSMRTDVNPSDIDYCQYPEGNLDTPASFGKQVSAEQIAGESAFAVARMVLLDRGKLSPEQAARTRDATHDWQSFMDRYAAETSPVSSADGDQTDVETDITITSPPVTANEQPSEESPAPRQLTASVEHFIGETTDDDPWGDAV